MTESNEKEVSGRPPRTRRRWLSAIFLAHVLGFVSSLFALNGTRTSQGTIAWIVSLNTFPYVAVPAYWVLGRSRFQGYVTAREEEDHDLDVLVRDLGIDVDSFEVEIPSERGAIGAAERLAQLPFTRRNGAELLIDGEATFESILAGIERAQSYVLVQFYIIKDDGLGRRLRDVLIRKAQAGIRVYLLYDEIGSHKLPDAYVDALRAAGADVRSFHSTRGLRNRFQLNFRNHRKIVVVDGLQSWVGGHNVGDEYLGLSEEFGPWRDTHVRLTGPTVQALQLSFAEDWHWATGDTLRVDWQPRASQEGDVAALILPSGPADRLETSWLMIQLALHSARERIWIASPYFVPDEAVMGALQLAALRGVDVRVLIPDNPDHLLVYLAAFAYLGDALDSGVKIYRYTEGFLHEKAFLVDDVVAGIGTANLDNRSFRLNFEITALVVDYDFGAEVREMFEADFDRARLMTRDDIDAKPLWFKLAVLAARLTAPVL